TMRRAGVVAAELEAVAVAPEGRIAPVIRAVVEGPAVFDEDRRRAHPQIPAVVGVPPRAAAAEDIARAEIPLGAEAIGVAADGWVVVQKRVAVQDEIVRRKNRS